METKKTSKTEKPASKKAPAKTDGPASKPLTKAEATPLEKLELTKKQYNELDNLATPPIRGKVAPYRFRFKDVIGEVTGVAFAQLTIKYYEPVIKG